MRIAISCENGRVFQRFGHTRQMKICDTENERIESEQAAGAAGSGRGAYGAPRKVLTALLAAAPPGRILRSSKTIPSFY